MSDCTCRALFTLERRRLLVLEQRIRDGLDSFLDVGIALAEVQRDRLYRASHATFGDYCRERWGFNRRHGYRLIAAAEVAEDLCPIGHTPPNEAQARELASLSPEGRREVYDQATAGGTQETTAAELRELAALAMEGLDPDERAAVLNGDDGRRADRARTVDRAAALASLRRALERAVRLADELGLHALARLIQKRLRLVPEE